MVTPAAPQQAFTSRSLGVLFTLSLLGIAGLGVMGLLGFEEPNNTLLLFSSAFILAAPLAVLVHLGLAGELTREEKRMWLRELTGSRAASAFSEYLTSGDRRATAKRRAE